MQRAAVGGWSRVTGTFKAVLVATGRWFDTSVGAAERGKEDPWSIDWIRVVPFLAVHLACLGIFWTGWSWTAVGLCAALYAVRMFAITGFYHRFFSHRTYRTSRAAQLAFALIGSSAVQRGPLWWAAHHRHHHAHSDEEDDLHSPVQHGLFWSHMGWFTCRASFPTDLRLVRDLARYPELRFLDRFDSVVPILLAASLFGLGSFLQTHAPGLGTSGPQLLFWGFFVSTVVLFHATCTINSLSHRLGRRRYETGDHSRNNFWLALLTFGEGWHNNHHRYPGATRQGFFWWEVDLTYYALRVLSWAGLIWDLRPVPLDLVQPGSVPAPPRA